eukprot:gb/GFBE01004858.1/.p1 GENE.gb/GFBE01004858.1/~~gb/GFBE01004858.1/.p1  ORF type:complete len:174 (+),score=27.88 gb/GFBE01004858.1/:1-522(+)
MGCGASTTQVSSCEALEKSMLGVVSNPQKAHADSQTQPTRPRQHGRDANISGPEEDHQAAPHAEPQQPKHPIVIVSATVSPPGVVLSSADVKRLKEFRDAQVLEDFGEASASFHSLKPREDDDISRAHAASPGLECQRRQVRRTQRFMKDVQEAPSEFVACVLAERKWQRPQA